MRLRYLCMERDARMLTPDAQFEIRRQAIRLNKKGHSHVEIASLLEVDRNTVGKWIREVSPRSLK